MSFRTYAFVVTSVLVPIACSESPVDPVIEEPIDHVRTVIAGRVLDPEGNPVQGAFIAVTVDCFSEPAHGCQISTSTAADSTGRFVTWIDQNLQVEFPVRADVEARPPLGIGYVLGTTVVQGLVTVFQVEPVADTTFVELRLPPNAVDSRRPIRIEYVGHRAGRLRADSERVYLSDPNGVAAMDQESGEWLWQRGSSGGLAGLPYVVVGDVVVMARDRTLTAVRALDGEILWSRDMALTGTLTGAEPGGLFASGGRGVVAYDLESGATRWTRELIGGGNVAIAASEGLVCAEILAYVECWEPSTGDRVWSLPTDFADWLAIVRDRVILGSSSGWTAMDGRTGDVLWQTAIDAHRPATPFEESGLLFACSSSECLAVRVDDGHVAWRTPLPEPGVPAAGDGAIYVISWEDDTSSLYVLDAATGIIRERILPDPFDTGGFGGTPAVGTDLVFVFGGFGNLYAFEKP